MLERFFDETGGMQLVLHSPYGGRINRALGLALRKKFCRTFNFELQAAASDDADRALARPAPQLPARRGARATCSSRDGRRHARARHPRLADVPGPLALEPQPLADRAAVPERPPQPAADPAHGVRRPHGRGVPAGGGVPGERHRPDRDPRPRARAPDHRRHAARGARRRRPARAARAHRGRRGARCTSSTPPSRRCSRTRSSPRGRTRSSTTRSCRTGAPTRCTLRRGLAVDLASIGALDPAAIERVHGEIDARARDRRRPRTTCCRSLVLAAAASRLARRCATSSSRAAAARCSDHDGTELWCTTERVRRRRAAPSPATTTRSRPLLRGHLESAGITTVDALAERHHARARPGRRRARRARARGLRAAGPLHPGRADDDRVGGAPPARPHALVLAPHPPRRRRAGHRPGLHALPAALAARRARHPARGRRRAARRARAAPGLRGRRGRRGSPSCSRAALRRYDPAWLDRLCHDGEVALAAAHAAGRDDADAPAGRAVEGHADLGGVPRRPAVAARSGPRRRATRPSRRRARPPRSSRCCASAARASPRARRRPPTGCPKTSSAALWDGVARGLLTSDGFGAIRAAGRRAGRRTRRRRRGASRACCAAPRLAGAPPPGAGRSCPATGADIDRDELAEAVAELLLHRWGVVFRDLAVHDSLRFPWRDLQWALRRLEDRGLVRGGRFVTGFSGEQYALPAAARAAHPGAQVAAGPASGSR